MATHLKAGALLLAALVLTSCSRGAPDWRGYWIAEGNESGISGFADGAPTLDGFRLLGLGAPWDAVHAVTVEGLMAAVTTNKSSGWGYPMMMSGPAPLQFLVTPDETLIVNIYREVRHVYTDGRAHPAADDLWPTTWGDSVGRWEGDTLVIDTVAVNPPRKYNQLGPPLSDRAHYVERIRRVAPDRLESDIRIEDPQTLTGPWSAHVVYLRARGLDRLVHGDFDNDRNRVDDGVFTIEPPGE